MSNPEIVEQLAAALPDHAYVQGRAYGPGDRWSAQWSTRSGLWKITFKRELVDMFLSANTPRSLSVVGPGCKLVLTQPRGAEAALELMHTYGALGASDE